MTSFSVDSSGQRIKTDILVSGYVRDVMNHHKIEIPDEIVGLCFLFWLITVCDEWDKSLCHNEWVDIDGSCVTITDKYKYGRTDVWCYTLFGGQVVESGVFKWCLKFNTEIEWICVGIIIDDKEVIEKNKVSCNDYGRVQGHGCFLFPPDGGLRYRGLWDDYCDEFDVKRDTMIEMTLDMDEHTIQYTVNDTDHKVVKIESLSGHRYRLAITVDDKGDSMELL